MSKEQTGKSNKNKNIQNAASAATSWDKTISRFNDIAGRFDGLSPENFARAFTQAYLRTWNDPNVQNSRIKAISPLPIEFSKEQIGDFLRRPYNSEMQLQQTSETLSVTAYPYYKMIKLYADIPTYRNYAKPLFLDKENAKSDGFMREAKLVDKLLKSFCPEKMAHEAVGKSAKFGKVAFYPRFDVDKSHNKVNYAFWQQLPQAYTKIIGKNSVSGWTVSFNLMWLFVPGADYRQFGDLLTPYIEDFKKVFKPSNSKTAYCCEKLAANARYFDIATEEIKSDAEGSPKVFQQDGEWFYWVSLPVDKVWVYEIDDTSAAVVPPLSGLLLTYSQQSDFEQAQLANVINPLLMFLTGEIEYFDSNGSTKEDNYRLSLGGRELFNQFFEDMLSATNTSGVGWFTAPVKNIKSHTFPASANANNIASSYSKYASGKSGLSALIPVDDDIKAAQVLASQKIETRFATATIYPQFERMMNCILESLNLNYEWRFKMFGDIFSEEDIRENARKDFEKGDTSSIFILAALDGESWLDKLSMVRAINASGIMDELIVPQSSYTQSKGEVGRPSKDISDIEGSDSTEKEIDAYGVK